MKRILVLSLFALLLTLPVSAARRPIDPEPTRGDGIITLKNIHTGELGVIRYRNEVSYLTDGMEAVNYLLRCRLSSKEASFPIELIELIDHLQEHFGEREIEVISGYRSPALNASLRRQGRRVASKSYHMQGMAMDIRIPGVSSRLVRDYTLSLARGGVGYYGQKGFVHVDVGPVRQW